MWHLQKKDSIFVSTLFRFRRIVTLHSIVLQVLEELQPGQHRAITLFLRSGQLQRRRRLANVRAAAVSEPIGSRSADEATN